jgi:hypothetical protein
MGFNTTAGCLHYTDRSRFAALVSCQRHPTVPPPLQIDGFVVQTYALYFAQTMLLGLIDMGIKKPS